MASVTIATAASVALILLGTLWLDREISVGESFIIIFMAFAITFIATSNYKGKGRVK